MYGCTCIEHKACEAVVGLAVEHLELVAQHRREPQGDRLVAQHLQQWQVDGAHRLPQPLLAEGPRAEALDIGHMRVEDHCQRAALHRHTARKSSALSRLLSRSAKSLVLIAGTNQL